ncbi:Carboxylesterase family protein [Hymenobacter gelipurpurascens]|uniref:Carboxylesterase family protein n=1 Tax=Hymenobacter gelipurpurascens TaxID=89968 RepID=A0A212UC63_9BACT|nr:alpha/beta hydrolase [Hymenobacter gelipurpurascens]SNC75839.1 Carboxylesterase family protein [Hymenobacter gelipurpurascens]
MKYFWLLAILGALLTSVAAQAQIDTTRGRYYQPRFRQVTVQRGVEFGQATTFLGQTQTLYMDVYQPTSDTVRRRPLIVLAHEGGFLTGTRDDAVMTALCTRLARLGYVTASIDYRLYFFPFDTVGIGRAAFRATQDMRAAIRFFRHDAATARKFRVHPQYIFVGGSSAGGFMSLLTAYMDKPAEVPAYLDLASLGGLEGNGGHLRYSSRPRGVVNMCGALADVRWLQPSDIPVCNIHGTRDGLVPYGRGRVGTPLPAQRVGGGGAISTRATAVGVPNVLRRLRGAGHVPYSVEPVYLDTVFTTARDFLRPLLGAGQPGPLLAAALKPQPRPVAFLKPRLVMPFRPDIPAGLPLQLAQFSPAAPDSTQLTGKPVTEPQSTADSPPEPGLPAQSATATPIPTTTSTPGQPK